MIYLDNNSTTRMADEVFDAMRPFMGEQYGNPSSLHLMGQTARNAVERARAQVAACINANPRNIIFTSGGTEADNLAILGTLEAQPSKRRILTTPVEHVAVRQACGKLATRGYVIDDVRVDRLGRVDPADVERLINDETALAAVMFANNETGVVFPIDRIAAVVASRGVPLHIDTVQAFGKVPINVQSLPCTTLALSAHKIHGPKGVGALYVAPGARLRGQLVGGHQERDLRPGTENVAGIVGFGVAAELAERQREEASEHMTQLRDALEAGILAQVKSAVVLGDTSSRLCNTTNMAFPGIDAEAILIGLSQKGVCASSGSACSSGSLEPSHVLQAMGIDAEVARGAIRFSLSKFTTASEIEMSITVVTEVVRKLASLTA